MIKYVGIIIALSFLDFIQFVQNSCVQKHQYLDNNCVHYRYDYRACKYILKVSCENLDGPSIELDPDLTERNEERIATQLNISHSVIKTLPHAAFFKVSSISDLTMEGVNLTSIQAGALDAHPHLMKIYLAGNNLVSIPRGIFNKLQALMELDLSRNRIENISADAFPHISMDKLNLSKNAISGLGLFLENFQYLNVLDLSFNNITTICVQGIKSSDDDKNIPVVNNTEKNSCSSLNWNIREIYLRNNKIRTIEPLGTNIQVFDLGNNMLRNLSVALFRQSTELKKLYLNANGISTIPNSLFSNLTHLRILDLSNNNLSSFSYGTFDGLTEIETLDVSGNRLKSLPGAFHSLDSLSNLYLQDNDLHDLNLDLVSSMSSLKAINLNGNKWNCRTLRNISTYLRRRSVNIIRGFHSEDTNVFGTACHDDENESSEKLHRITSGQKVEVNLDNSNLQNFFNTDFKNSALYRFFVDDFGNTSFANSLKDSVDKKQTFEHNVETAFNRLERNFENSSGLFLETVQNITKAIDRDRHDESLRDLIETMDRNDESLRELIKTMDRNDESLRELIKTYMDKLENSKSKSIELENLTSSLKNLENCLEKFSRIITHADVQSPVVYDVVDKNFSEAIAEKFVAEHFLANQNNAHNTFFVFFLILMIAIVLLISAILYIVAFRLKFDSTRRDIQMSPIMEDRS